jgi:hypothetical protein
MCGWLSSTPAMHWPQDLEHRSRPNSQTVQARALLLLLRCSFGRLTRGRSDLAVIPSRQLSSVICQMCSLGPRGPDPSCAGQGGIPTAPAQHYGHVTDATSVEAASGHTLGGRRCRLASGMLRQHESRPPRRSGLRTVWTAHTQLQLFHCTYCSCHVAQLWTHLANLGRNERAFLDGINKHSSKLK